MSVVQVPFLVGETSPMVPLVLCNNPVSGDLVDYAFDRCLTLAEIVAAVPDLPEAFWQRGIVTLTQADKFMVVPRHFWARGEIRFHMRLKATSAERVMIRLHVPAGKSGGKGSKSTIAIVATIALLAVGAAISGGALAGLLGPGTLLAGSFGAQAFAAAVTFVGRLAISMALKPAAQADNNSSQQSTLGQAGASGNLISPGGSLYYCAGIAKVYPHLVALPLVELVGDEELVEAPYMLAGPHVQNNITVEDTPIGEIEGLSYIVNTGIEAVPQSLLGRYGFQTQPQFELKAHVRKKEGNLYELAHDGSPELDIPKPYLVTSKFDPDELWLQLLWPAGMTDTNGNVAVVMPIRIQLRAVGTSAWINLPELMFHSSLSVRFSKKIVLSWDAPPTPIGDQPYNNGAWHSFHNVPAQAAVPVGVGAWVAQASFNGGVAKNATARVKRSQDGFTLYLDPAVFPRGKRWNISMIRGAISRPGSWAASGLVFNPATYTPGPYSMFHWIGGGPVFYTINVTSLYAASIVESCVVMRFASVWNKKPIPKPGNASIEVRGRNINVTQLACEGAALIKIWNGVAFDGASTSENPADHFFHALAGNQTSDRVPETYCNLPEISAWHADNIVNNRKVSAVFDGREWRESLNAIAGAGLAKLKEGRLWGVARQRNTHLLGVPARQVFSHLNIFNLNWNKSFAPVPDAARVSFRNRALNFDQDERLVLRPGISAAEVNRIVNLDAVAIVDATQVEEFFTLYLAAAQHRDVIFSFETWFEGLACEEGDIIQLNHLCLSERHASGRIVEVERNGSDEVVSVVLDSAIDPNDEQGLETVLDLATLEDMAAQGVELGATIATGPGPVNQPLVALSSTSKRIVFEVPFLNDDVKPQNMVMLGPRQMEMSRFEVTQVEPADDFKFTLTMVPEAPEMWGP